MVAKVCRSPLKVRPGRTLPVSSSALRIGRHDARSPEHDLAQGRPSEFAQKVIASCLGAAATMANMRAGKGTQTGSFVFPRLVSIEPF